MVSFDLLCVLFSRKNLQIYACTILSAVFIAALMQSHVIVATDIVKQNEVFRQWPLEGNSSPEMGGNTMNENEMKAL